MFSTIKSGIASYLNRYSKAKTHQLLIALDDDLLNQAKISRDLLQRGVDYWPWQIDENQANTPDMAVQKAAETAGLKSITTDVNVATNVDVDLERVAAPIADSEVTTEKAA